MLPLRGSTLSWIAKAHPIAKGLPAAKFQKIDYTSTLHQPSSKEFIELKSQVNCIRTLISDFTRILSNLYEVKPGVFDFTDNCFEAWKDQVKKQLEAAEKKSVEFNANPQLKLKPQFLQLDLWIGLLRKVLESKTTQIVETAKIAPVANLSSIDNHPSLSAVTVERWVKGKDGTYKVPDVFLTLYYSLLIKAGQGSIKSGLLNFLSEVIRESYPNNFFSIAFSSVTESHIFKYVLHSDTNQIPFETEFGKPADSANIPLQGTLLPLIYSNYFAVPLPIETALQVKENLDQLVTSLGQFYSSLNAEASSRIQHEVREKFALLLSILKGYDPAKILSQEMHFYALLAKVDFQQDIRLNDKIDLSIEAKFHPLMIAFKALLIYEKEAEFRSFFLKQFENWIFLNISKKALESYIINTPKDLSQLPVSFLFKQEDNEYLFVHHIESFLAGSQAKNGDSNLMAYCVEYTMNASATESEEVPLPNLKGIENIGNSCYINSVLQALLTFPCLTKSFNEEGIVSIRNKIQTLNSRGDVPVSRKILNITWLAKLIPLQESATQVFAALQTTTKMSSVMVEYRSKLFDMGLGGLIGLARQQDAAEIIPCILEAAGYEIRMQSMIKGSHTHENSTRTFANTQAPEPFYLFPLALELEGEAREERERPVELLRLINDFMNSKNPESCKEAWKPDDNNPEIKIYDFITERRVIENIPQMIGLHFKRFNGDRQKINREILFPNENTIDMTAYVSPDLLAEGQRAVYRLKALVIHAGYNIHGGHYYTHANREGNWYEFNDDRVTRLSHPHKEGAYIAFFELI